MSDQPHGASTSRAGSERGRGSDSWSQEPVDPEERPSSNQLASTPSDPDAPSNPTALLALIFAFVFAPVGVLLGVKARREIRRTGHQGYGLATAGMWIGIAVIAIVVAYSILPEILVAFTGPAGSVTSEY